jgi:alpha-beta hydrolase superfamily lysophospholipase
LIRFLQRRWRWLCVIAIAAMLLLPCAGAWIFGTLYCAPYNRPVPPPQNLLVEPVAFPSASGATLRGWLVATNATRGVVILQHGVHSTKSSLVERAQFLSGAGYAVLLYDFQAHGESVGKRITFGFLESRDAQAAVAFVKNRFPGKPVGVVGISLGAAAAALAEPPLDVQCLVFESMFPTIEDATKDRMEIQLGTLSRWLSPLLTAQIPLRAGCGVEDLRPARCVEKITAPKLFLAGTRDRETKIAEAEAMFRRAAEPKEFVPIAGARHEDLLNFAPGQYKQLILSFLEAHLK